MTEKPIRVSILVFPECDPSIIYGIFDTLWSAGQLWDPLTAAGAAGKSIFEPKIVAAECGPLKLVTGVSILPQATIADTPSTDIVFVPNVFVATPGDVEALDARLIDWLCARHEDGAALYAACGGSIVLARAGLLDGQEATTHWGYVPLFKQCFPKVTLHHDRILVQGGPGHNVVCSGGASSWQDLCLMLIARYAGTDEALRISKIFLYQWHREGQLPYAAMIRNANHSDAVVARCQEWIADHYAAKDVIAALVRTSRLPKRTFDRRFKAATGYPPLAYVQALRIEEAKQLLETGDLAVDTVGRSVGYEDAASFHRLFRRLAGMAPGAYRKKFQIPNTVEAALKQAGKPHLRRLAG
jgi:transcriptional regulator GlxA family with amidase domain